MRFSRPNLVGYLIASIALSNVAIGGVREQLRTILKHESFDRDPGWEGLNNRAVKPKSIQQDFGYGEGKIGGAITIAAEPAYYAKKIEPKTLNDVLTASGTLFSDG